MTLPARLERPTGAGREGWLSPVEFGLVGLRESIGDSVHRSLARAIYYPTLGYNILLGRVLRVRAWWSEVDESLILGARPLWGDPARFKALGVTGVVNTCEELPGPIAEYERLGIEQLWIPTTDFNHPSQANVARGAEFIEQHVERGGRVYVHCKAGRARSATVALWWLVRYQGMSPEQAQQLLLKSRPHANPNVFQRPVIQALFAAWSESQKLANLTEPKDRQASEAKRQA